MSAIYSAVRKWRVFEFHADQSEDAVNHLSAPIVAIDRNDRLRDDIENVFGSDADRECRPLNIGLLLDDTDARLVVTRFDQSGIAAAEIIRILNRTGFKGELKFIVDEHTVPLHLTRRLKKLAIDFDLSTSTVSNLGILNKSTQVPSINPILTSAMG